MEERIQMKLQLMKTEVLSNLNVLFREKVQLEEKIKDNEINIQFGRGSIEALNKAQEIVKEISKGEAIEGMKLPSFAEFSENSAARVVPEVRKEVEHQ